mmetsp:Transcript_6142/g.17147  ORF Transcript_6142/g.17147 Transcript_6142/m.17147 type:complete len:136 (-) Transcript_6142:84-491(-)
MDSAALDKALRLMEQYFNRVDPTKAMRLLHDVAPNLPVRRMLEFLRKSLRHTWSEQRRQQVTRQLLRVQEVKAKKELIDEQVKEVVIDEGTRCQLCGRPMGTSAMLRYPNGAIVHLSCGSADPTTPPTAYRYLPS